MCIKDRETGSPASVGAVLQEKNKRLVLIQEKDAPLGWSESVTDKQEDEEMFWFFRFRRDKQLPPNRRDTVADNKQKRVLVADVAIPADSDIGNKEHEKMEKWPPWGAAGGTNRRGREWLQRCRDRGLNRLTSDIGVQQRTGPGRDTAEIQRGPLNLR